MSKALYKQILLVLVNWANYTGRDTGPINEVNPEEIDETLHYKPMHETVLWTKPMYIIESTFMLYPY